MGKGKEATIRQLEKGIVIPIIKRVPEVKKGLAKDLAELDLNIEDETKDYDERFQYENITQNNLAKWEIKNNKYFLSQGLKDNLFWYGVTINSKPAIITNTKALLRDNRFKSEEGWQGDNEINLIFEYNDILGDLGQDITKDTINDYIEYHDAELNITNPELLFKQIKEKILFFMDIDEKLADVMACWILSTYVFQVFDWFPLILINAPSGSGKTKCGNLLIKMAFKGYSLVSSGDSTAPTIFRTLECNRGSILIDEYERIEKSEAQQLINQILNASATRDSYIIRLERVGSNWVPQKFNIYCPKIICNITGLNPVTLSRCLVFRWYKSLDKAKTRQKIESKKYKSDFDEVIQKCYLFGLENAIKVRNIYETLELPTLDPRMEDNLLPLFSIAKLIGPDAESSLNWYVENLNDSLENIQTEEPVKDVFLALMDMCQTCDVRRTCQDIAVEINIGEIVGLEIKDPAKWLGRKLKLYGFKQYRSGDGKRREYVLNKEFIAEILKKYFITTITN